MDLLLPRTDAGVVVQLAALAAVTGIAVWSLRAKPEARLVAIGIAVVVLSLIGVRALH